MNMQVVCNCDKLLSTKMTSVVHDTAAHILNLHKFQRRSGTEVKMFILRTHRTVLFEIVFFLTTRIEEKIKHTRHVVGRLRTLSIFFLHIRSSPDWSELHRHLKASPVESAVTSFLCSSHFSTFDYVSSRSCSRSRGDCRSFHGSSQWSLPVHRHMQDIRRIYWWTLRFCKGMHRPKYSGWRWVYQRKMQSRNSLVFKYGSRNSSSRTHYKVRLSSSRSKRGRTDNDFSLWHVIKVTFKLQGKWQLCMEFFHTYYANRCSLT